MPNTHFQFRQFRIEQGSCEMKVCTDACILGAYASHPDPRKILDIGTGTGLLALMLAQKYSQSQIQALEIEPGACEQATQNFSDSPWSDRLELLPCAFQDYQPAGWYDLIISNPPFYANHLKPTNAALAGARHSTWMEHSELIQFAMRFLKQSGFLWILLPPASHDIFREKAGQQGLGMTRQLAIRNTIDADIIRYVSLFQKGQENPVPTFDQLTIREHDNVYSQGVQELLSAFYLEYNFT